MAELFLGGRRLKANHVNAIPRHIIAVKSLSRATKRDGSLTVHSHAFQTGHCTVSRIARDTVSGRKELPINSPADFENVLVEYTRGRQTTWIVGLDILNDFRLLQCPELFEQAKLSIDWPRTKRKKENNDSDNPHCHGLAVISSPPTIIACRVLQTQGRVVFVDIANWFGRSIGELAEQLGIVHTVEPEWNTPIETRQAYCEWLAGVVHDIFIGLCTWCKDNDMGLFRYTAAGQSMSYFRHHCQTHDIYFHEDSSIKEFERLSYYGGRTEVFRKGPIAEDVYKLDIASFYPSIMSNHLYPYTIHSYDVRTEYGEIPDRLNLAECVADVLIETDVPIYPIRVGIANYYPIGRFYTTLAGPELKQALDFGHLVSLGTWTRYKMAPIFTYFVQECWRLRQLAKQSGNRLYVQLAKQLANSLYGKFAQLAPRWEFVPDMEPAEAWDEWPELDFATKQVVIYRSFGYNVQRQIGREEKSGTFPAISAFVTAYGRLRMNLLRGIATPNAVYYQGVDSLIVNNDGYRNLHDSGMVHENTLGQLQLEMVANHGEIRGCMDYTLGSKVVCAGLPGVMLIADVQDNLCQRYWSKRGLFSGRGIRPLESSAYSWREHNSTFKRKYKQDGSSDAYDYCELTSVLESAGIGSASNNSALTRHLFCQSDIAPPPHDSAVLTTSTSASSRPSTK